MFHSLTLRQREPRSGFSLLEVIISLGLLAIVSLPTMLHMLKSQRLVAESDLYSLARLAAESELEYLRTLEFHEIAEKADGNRFLVAGLPKREGNPEEQGLVEVFLNESDPDNPAVSEGAAGYDLDGNLQSNDQLSNDSKYRLLPVRISHDDIDWPRASRHARRRRRHCGRRTRPRGCGRDKHARRKVSDEPVGAGEKAVALNRNLCSAGQFPVVG